MPRKRCCGLISEYPVCHKFISEKNENHAVMILGIEEMEAIRLKDMIGYDQEVCGKEMGLSRTTFQRILIGARKKIATALVEGHSIEIRGGHYQMKNRVFECVDCGETWEVEPCTEGGKHGYEIACPKCGSMKKTKLDQEVRHVCGGSGDHKDGGGCCGGR